MEYTTPGSFLSASETACTSTVPAMLLPHQHTNTPILCIHGEKDYRIVSSQAMSAFNAARYRGVPAQLLIFPDENHWVLKPQNGILWQRTFFAWLDRWLK